MQPLKERVEIEQKNAEIITEIITLRKVKLRLGQRNKVDPIML
jgi:hypothetical protein